MVRGLLGFHAKGPNTWSPAGIQGLQLVSPEGEALCKRGPGQLPGFLEGVEWSAGARESAQLLRPACF